jgi:hypothetical protein
MVFGISETFREEKEGRERVKDRFDYLRHICDLNMKNGTRPCWIWKDQKETHAYGEV